MALHECTRRCRGRIYREADREGRPLPLTVAGGFNGPAMKLDEMTRDRQPETEARLPLAREVALPIPFENVRQQLSRDPASIVRDGQHRFGAVTFQAHRDRPAFRGELD